MASLAFLGNIRVPRLSKLLEEVHAGEIRVPRFQRPFIWTDEQRLALMASIYGGYPIGTLLVWRTQTHRLRTYDHLGPLKLPPESDDDATRQYLLDGHQRLTTLFAALGPGLYARDGETGAVWLPEDIEERERWPIYFDLESDTGDQHEKNPFHLARRNEQPRPTWLSLEILFDSYALREFEEKLREKKYGKALVNRVQAVADAFRDYAIPVMPIATEDLKRVTTSFKRVNSGGTPMSEVHMINALTHGPAFDFLARIEELTVELKPVGWASFDPQMILNVCKARLELSLYDEEPEVLANKLVAKPEVLESVKNDIVKVAKVLSEIAGVRSPASLPYSYQAVLLADALQGVDLPSKDVHEKLRVWFWATTLAEYFRWMTKSLFERARAHLQGVVHGDADPCPQDMKTIIDPIGRFDFRTARSRGLALLLAEQSPRGILGGSDDPFEFLAEYGSDALSKLVSEREVDEPEYDLVHGAGNRFLMHPKRVGELHHIKDISSLFRQLIPGEVLASHLIDAEAWAAIERKDWHTVLVRRRDALEQLERARAEECGLTYRPST